MKYFRFTPVAVAIIALVGIAYSQVPVLQPGVQVVPGSQDPCAYLPKISAFFPAATPTARIAGIAGQQITVCGISAAMATATASLITFSYGEVTNAGASPTPCATASPGGTLYQLPGTATGAAGAGVQNVGTGNTTLIAVPTPVGTPADFCVWMASGTEAKGITVTYVQH